MKGQEDNSFYKKNNSFFCKVKLRMLILQALENPIFDSVILLFICIILSFYFAFKKDMRRERNHRIIVPIVPIVPITIT